MPSARDDHQQLSMALEGIMKDRFVHSLSHLTYDQVAALWHIDRESEELMSRIASQVIVGMFCLQYLSHINTLINTKAGIKSKMSARSLTDKGVMAELKAKVSRNKEAASFFKQAAAMLRKFLESIDIKTLEDVTKIAHTGDYLFSSLEDMKDSDKEDYALWLASIPYYYEKDLQYLGLLKKAGVAASHELTKESAYDAPHFWYEQFPVELFHFEKIHADHRMNLNEHLLPARRDGGTVLVKVSKDRKKRRLTRARG